MVFEVRDWLEKSYIKNEGSYINKVKKVDSVVV